MITEVGVTIFLTIFCMTLIAFVFMLIIPLILLLPCVSFFFFIKFLINKFKLFDILGIPTIFIKEQ